MTLFSKIKEGVGYSIQKGIKKKFQKKFFVILTGGKRAMQEPKR